MFIRAYAKINLGLKVLGKRDDGYHELEMVMVNINLFDSLYIKKDKIDNVIMNKNICKIEDNIVYKTISYIKKKYNINECVKVRIIKRIPDGGGLGGGSSDAASTIIGLNKIWNLCLSQDEMVEIAMSIGSDVPFFLYNCLSHVKGRGERVYPINKEIKEKIILLFPKIKSSTKEIFNNYIDNDNSNKIENITENIDNKEYYKYLFNDLEDTTMKVYPSFNLKEIVEYGQAIGVKKVLMSGSGSTIFAIGMDKYSKQVGQFKRKFKEIKVLRCKTISCCKSIIR